MSGISFISSRGLNFGEASGIWPIKIFKASYPPAVPATEDILIELCLLRMAPDLILFLSLTFILSIMYFFLIELLILSFNVPDYIS